ncbi:hypothetical protein OG474_11215 [Kribbella sp. NBC_01505]|uniref:hypothetical protein n=1 Tax=Kribbella sp. NBC_01505 TaxID=2903580 RepID=UPI003870D5AD
MLKKLAAVLGFLSVAAVVTPATAQAAEFSTEDTAATIAAQKCPADTLCLYAGPRFTDMRLSTRAFGRCWWLSDFDLDEVSGDLQHVRWGVESYVNNRKVKAHILGDRVYRILPGGSSSNTTSAIAKEYKLCI